MSQPPWATMAPGSGGSGAGGLGQAGFQPEEPKRAPASVKVKTGVFGEVLCCHLSSLPRLHRPTSWSSLVPP